MRNLIDLQPGERFRNPGGTDTIFELMAEIDTRGRRFVDVEVRTDTDGESYIVLFPIDQEVEVV